LTSIFYIDDNIGITPDINNNALRMTQVIPLAIRTLARPLNASDVIPRKDIILLKKFKEVKKALGWILNTRSLQLSLPSEKYTECSNAIAKLIAAKKANHKSLESLIGRINHIACVFHLLRHYMGRLYQALYRVSSSNGWTKFSDSELADLDTISGFLSAAHRGLSLNNLVFRKPMLLYRSDASEFGIRGYNLISGIAWWFELPLPCRLHTSLNSLEFLACMISIWIDSFIKLLNLSHVYSA
jgi:hypothetical protein